MIISASRRTDIPAFYADWFMNRVRAGFCMVANPRNPRQVSRVSLAPADVDAIVFWSKDPAPLVRHLGELDAMGFRYYFLVTLNDYPVHLEPCVPPLADRIRTFCGLGDRIGKGRVVWRYDPVIISRAIDADYHTRSFSAIAAALRGHSERVIVSILDLYPATRHRLAAVEERTGDSFVLNPFEMPELGVLVRRFASIATDNDMEIQSCAEDDRLAGYGVCPGKCIDDKLIRDKLGVDVSAAKDKGQRARCLCVASRDIGANECCVHGCEYCYATGSAEKADRRHQSHDPESELLLTGS